ncbi:MAG: hypothetical protein ABIT37_05450 [Luteolibacter sp.]
MKRVQCTNCDNMILEATASSTGGICMPCMKQIERNARNAAAKPPTADDDERDRLSEAIQTRVKSSIGSGCVVQFSAYRLDAREMPVDNLDEIAVSGAVQFVQVCDPSWGEGQDYRSATLTSPTWMEVAAIANEMIGVTGDRQHCFLEGFTRLRSEDGIDVLELDMGS